MKFWQLAGKKSLKSVTTIAEDGTEPTYDLPIPNEEYIKVKLTKTPLCASDWSNYLGNYGRYPIILGRSAVGLVSESEFPEYKTGQRIYLSPYHESISGAFLTRGVDIDGYLGDYALVPINDVYTLPEGIREDDLVFIEDIALAINALERIDLSKGEYLLLYGASYLNIIIAQLAIYYQSIPIIIDKDNDRLELAENNGIYYTVNFQEELLSNKIVEITAGKLVDHIIFDTDAFNDIDAFTEFVKNHGNICLVGFNKHPGKISCDMQRIIGNELSIIGVTDGYSAIPSAINMIANKIINTEQLIEKFAPYDKFPEVIYELGDKTVYLKTVIND